LRQYALEKLGESGEADTVRSRHRDHYTAMAAVLDAPAGSNYEQCIEQAETEIDNLRAAFAWSRENSDIELALTLASSLQPLWGARGRLREGLAWFDAALTDYNAQHVEVTAAVRARALADRALLAALTGAAGSLDHAQQALAIAREVDDPALLVRALTARGSIAALSAEVAGPYFAEAIGLARALDDRWRLSQILAWQALAALTAGDPIAGRAAAEEGRDLADAIGDRSNSRVCRWCLGTAQTWQGDQAGAAAQLAELAAEAEAAHDVFYRAQSLTFQGAVLAWQGDTGAARGRRRRGHRGRRRAGRDCLRATPTSRWAPRPSRRAMLAAAAEAHEAAWRHQSVLPATAAAGRRLGAEAALAGGDPVAARRWADDAVTTTTGFWLMLALTTRAGWRSRRVSRIRPNATPTTRSRSPPACNRIWTLPTPWSASPLWPVMAAVTAKRPGSSARHTPFGSAWARSASRSGTPAMTPRRRRFMMPWASKTSRQRGLRARPCPPRRRSPTRSAAAANANDLPAAGHRSPPPKRDVVRLVSEGLANSDIATRLFVSPRTVQTHLTHVYTKLGLTSRVQLVQEAARHS